MALNSEMFLNSFNRIEKWMREELNNPSNMGFSEMVRRLSKRHDLAVASYEEDLLQMAQLRNAIVHEKIDENFVIAEPNEWSLNRIQFIESSLTAPEKVLPRFKKRVTGFEMDVPLADILRIIAKKRYSQFPLYRSGKFEGLITLRTIGYWFALEAQKGYIQLDNRQGSDLLMEDGKTTNYQFVAGDTPIFTVRKMFRESATLEAILITHDGDPNGNLLGIIRPRDILQEEKD